MTQVRMLSPALAASPVNVFGRPYQQVPGTVLDVPTGDAGALAANGWFRVALSGPTAQRPTVGQAQAGLDGLAPGLEFFDITLGKCIFYDGSNWRDPSTGAAV